MEAILRGTYEAIELIIVDNAPTDSSTQEMVNNRFGGDARVRYIRQDVAGASLARNIGAQAGAGELLAFTDDDDTVDPAWIAALVAGFNNPQVDCVSGLTVPASLETPAERAFMFYAGDDRGFQPRVYDLDQNRADTQLYPYTAGLFGSSANVAFRRQAFLDQGGFDLTLGPGTPTFGAEDIDLFLSFILSGRRIAYEPAAILRHAMKKELIDVYWQIFAYSASFTAMLTKRAVNDRNVAVDLARRVPRVLPMVFSRRHRLESGSAVGEYPNRLRWIERAGYLYGPLAYGLSRLTARQRRAGLTVASARGVESATEFGG